MKVMESPLMILIDNLKSNLGRISAKRIKVLQYSKDGKFFADKIRDNYLTIKRQ